MDSFPLATTAAEEQTRRSSIASLRAAGIEPYPAAAFQPSMPVCKALRDAPDLIQSKAELRFAGRITGIRKMGRSCFVDILDDGDRIQAFISAKDVGSSGWGLIEHIDLGDFLGCEGQLFVTRTGETTLNVLRLVILGKALRCPPLGKRRSNGEVYQALGDTGRLLRERHVALLTDQQLRQRLVTRDRIIRGIRSYFHAEGFIEVETPVLSRAYGGASAKPFMTRSNALDADLYLRVAPECHLKRALCGGLSRVFEIGKNFRNEGIDHSHNPEFTALEWYETYSDYRHQMHRFETLVAQLVREVNDGYEVNFRGRAVNFAPPWPRLRVIDAVAQALGRTPGELTDEEANRLCRQFDIHRPRMTWGAAITALFERVVEPKLWGPVFVIDHPVEGSPLTKLHREDSRFVERFEPYAGGMEIGNAYSELNDPIEQRRRLLEQDLARDEHYGIDETFLRAIEDGMPQTGGAGMGIDRIVMLLTGADRLSDVILFPAG